MERESEDPLKILSAFMDFHIKALPSEKQEVMKRIGCFRMSLVNESDRGCALMAAAYLDERLKELLKRFMVEDRASVRMLEFEGAFGSFSSRINGAYCLGLIPKNVQRDLHILRKVRNEFAHKFEQIGFDDEPIKSRCGELVLDVREGKGSPRQSFTRAMMVIVGVIEHAIYTCSRREVMPDHDVNLNLNQVAVAKRFLQDAGFEEAAKIIK